MTNNTIDVPPTAESVLNSGIHGRIRRQERDIQKIDLQRARRYGMEEPARLGRIKYTYGGVVFIYDPIFNREVTSYRSPDAAPSSSGTKNAQPIILPKEKSVEGELSLAMRTSSRDLLVCNTKTWTSHSVLVVDMSGSMRRDDVNGARCRSDGVWMTLARDFVKRPLQSKTRSKTDLISVILMRDKAEVVFKYEMTDWVLYNKFIDLRNWTEQRPAGPGNYMPALEAAEELLMKNQTSKCSLSLMFFSDGRPSDKGDFKEKMGNIASKFGRRLSVACIGMADEGEDFSTLGDMVDEATSYGAIASFGKPSLDADSLSNIITGLASSLTTSKTEMTNLATGETKQVRMDITRERKDAPDDLYLTSDWNCYNTDSKYVNRIWSWSTKLNNFVQVMDTRCGVCGESGDDSDVFRVCSHCECFYLCSGCHTNSERHKHRYSGQCARRITRKEHGRIVEKDLPSFDVALKEQIFGEGAERIVRKCRFLDTNGNFIGPVMVAKESRFVDESYNDYKLRMKYHEEFMRTQGMASEMAEEFNNALLNVPKYFGEAQFVRNYLRKIPKIKFLEPYVVETQTDDGEYNVLVEPMLEGKYEKFNDNMGMVQGQNSSVNMDDLSRSMSNLDIGNAAPSGGIGLGMIAEEESEEEEDSDEEIIDEENKAPEHGSYSLQKIKDFHIPQTFSHFSYEKSKRYFMVVDLQGVLKTNNDGTKCYELTDPVIHKRRKKKKAKLQQYTFGRTDRGDKGMKAFFRTHQCNELCRLLGLQKDETNC